MRGAWAHASRACSDLARKYLRPTCSARTRGAELHSDIDVAVYIDEAHKDLSAFGLRAEISTLLMEGLQDNSVDLLIFNDAPPVLYYHVLRDGVRVLSRDLAKTTTREGRAVSRYCDFVPQLAKMEAARSFAERSES